MENDPRITKKGHIKNQKDKKINIKMNNYIYMRKKREEFRKNVIDIITGKNVDTSMCGNWFTENDMNILRYYYYIMHGVDSTHIPPIDESILNNILKLVPIKWQNKFKDTMKQVIKEASDDYTLSIKKSVVDFVLQDPLIDESIINNQVMLFRNNFFTVNRLLNKKTFFKNILH